MLNPQDNKKVTDATCDSDFDYDFQPSDYTYTFDYDFQPSDYTYTFDYDFQPSDYTYTFDYDNPARSKDGEPKAGFKLQIARLKLVCLCYWMLLGIKIRAFIKRLFGTNLS